MVVLGFVFTLWALVPASIVRPKIGWALQGVCLVLVIGAVAAHATRSRWSATSVLLLVPGLLAALASPRYGAEIDLLHGFADVLLLGGCALLAANLDGRQVGRLVTVILGVAGLELAVASASAFLGLPAPWGYLGKSGALYGINEILPALGGRATGTMGHSLPFGTLMAVAALLALFARPAQRWPLRVLMALGFAGGVVLSGSRSAALLLLVVCVLGWLWPGATRLGAPGKLVLVAGVVLSLWRIDVLQLRLVSSLSGTGSLTHRLGAIEAAGRLLGRPAAELMFGSGDGALPALFARGLLQQDGFGAVDDQFVTTLALAGLAGLVALLAAIVLGLLGGERTTRPAALLAVLMFLSFDVLEWTATALLFALLIALGTAVRKAAAQPAPVDP